MMEKVSVDAVMSERELGWRALFGDRPMPTPEPDAVQKYAGTVGLGLGITDEDIEEGLAEIE